MATDTSEKGLEDLIVAAMTGWNDGTGNPPNPDGMKTDYLWKTLLTPSGLADILENYAQIVEEKNAKTGQKKRKQVFPRYHQLRVLHRLLVDVAENGAGKRYLLQHSAGSGKSNSIAWLAHQLIGLRKVGKTHGCPQTADQCQLLCLHRHAEEQDAGDVRRALAAGRRLGHGHEVLGLVVHGDFGAELAARLALLRRAGGGDEVIPGKRAVQW